MLVRLTQLDGKLPNLALMKLASWHLVMGDEVYLSRSPWRGMDEIGPMRVYGSAIFESSRDHVDVLKAEFPEAIVGGTGTGKWGTVDCG